MLGMEKLTGEF